MSPRPARTAMASLSALLTAAAAHAQVTPVSALWREWTTLEAEWQAEREVYPVDRTRNQAIRQARQAGLDPRPTSPVRASRPAGPQFQDEAPLPALPPESAP